MRWFSSSSTSVQCIQSWKLLRSEKKFCLVLSIKPTSESDAARNRWILSNCDFNDLLVGISTDMRRRSGSGHYFLLLLPSSVCKKVFSLRLSSFAKKSSSDQKLLQLPTLYIADSELFCKSGNHICSFFCVLCRVQWRAKPLSLLLWGVFFRLTIENDESVCILSCVHVLPIESNGEKIRRKKGVDGKKAQNT